MKTRAYKVLLTKQWVVIVAYWPVQLTSSLSVSVSEYLPRLNTNHKVFTVNEELSDKYVIGVFTTLTAMESVKMNKATGPDNIPALVFRNHANAPPLTALFSTSR